MKKVICDVDGVLLNIHTALENRLKELGFDFSMDRVLTYDFNKSLSKELVPNWLKNSDTSVGEFYLNVSRQMIFELFGQSSLFETAEFDEKAVNALKNLMKYSCISVVIYSLSFSQEIANIKSKRLSEVFKGYNYSFVSVVGGDKPALGTADYIIEDSHINLPNYADNAVKFLIDKPYNQIQFNPSYKEIIEKAVRVDSVSQACSLILSKIA